MAKQTSGGAYTPPKGRPTPGRREHAQVVEKRRKSTRRVRMEWTIAIVVLIAVLVAVFIFFGDAFPDGGSMTPGEAPL